MAHQLKGIQLTICKKSIMIILYTLAQGFSQQIRRVVTRANKYILN